MLALQPSSRSFSLFLFNVTATPETYTLSLHDALPIFTPYESWRHDHAVHHATAGDLDRRGVGDLPTLTVAEYRAKSWRGRLGYRLFRNPLIMFTLGPIFSMILLPRIPKRGARPRIRRSILRT